MTNGAKVIRVAETQLGVSENPWGSNRGPVEKYQRPWGSWMVSQPWCGAFTDWCYKQAGVDDSGLNNPGTWAICAAADRMGGLAPKNNEAPPGSLLIRCGTHVELVVRDRRNGLIDTIGGNVGHMVKRVVRSKGDWRIIVPPAIAEDANKPAITYRLSYGFDDLDVRPTLYGGWATKSTRDNIMSRFLESRKDWWVRPVRVDKPSPFAFEAGRPGTYNETWKFGGWLTEEIRDAKLAGYAQRTGHRNLVKWSKKIPVADTDGFDFTGGLSEDDPLV